MNNSLCNYTNDDLVKLLLRLTVGILMLFHGYAKATHGIDGIIGMLEEHGIPGFIAYGVYIGEIVAPLMLIFGYKVKIAAVILIAMMIFITVVPDVDSIFKITDHGAWAIELNIFYIIAPLCTFLLGAGKYSIDKK